MLRSIVAVVASYIVMVIVIVASFAGLLFGPGPDRLLKPGSWDGTVAFCIAVPAITTFAALLGGWMCARIGRAKGPVLALAALVFVLGMVSAYFTLQKPAPKDPRPPGLTMEQFREQGREPTWVAISNPIIGAVGVLCAGLAVARSRRTG